MVTIRIIVQCFLSQKVQIGVYKRVMFPHVSHLESLPEESLFFIISPKDIVLAKVCIRFTVSH